MIHTRPNLMRNVGCCYGNSIHWNFSMLVGFTLTLQFKRTSWRGASQWGQTQCLGDDSVHLFFDRRECNSIMRPHQLAQRSGRKDVILRLLWNPQVSFLWPDLEIIRRITKFSMWRMLSWAKETMKTMSLQKIRICFVVLSCLIFKHKYVTLKLHLNLST